MTVTTKNAKNGARLYYVDSKRVSRQIALEVAAQNRAGNPFVIEYDTEQTHFFVNAPSKKFVYTSRDTYTELDTRIDNYKGYTLYIGTHEIHTFYDKNPAKELLAQIEDAFINGEHGIKVTLDGTIGILPDAEPEQTADEPAEENVEVISRDENGEVEKIKSGNYIYKIRNTENTSDVKRFWELQHEVAGLDEGAAIKISLGIHGAEFQAELIRYLEGEMVDEYAITEDAFNFAVEYEIEEAAIVAGEARAIARILANETLKIRYDKAKTQVKHERYENGYCGWYFKGKNRDNWECNVTKATACLTRYGLSRFEFIIFSENEPAVIDNNGYDETAFELLPTVDELNDVEVDEPEQVAENHIAEQYQFAAKFADKLFRVERFSDEQINAVIIAIFDGNHDAESVKKLIDDFKAANFNEAQEVAARLEEIIADEAKRAADKPTPEISEKESLEIDKKILVDEIDEAREALAQAEADSEVPQEHIDNLRDVIDRKLNEYYETYAKLDALNSTPEIKQAADTVTEIQKMQSAFASAIEDSNVDFSATLTINGETLTFEEGQLLEIASTRYGAYCQIRNGRKIFYYRGNRVSKQDFFAHIATEDKATDERAAITQFVAKFGGSEIKPGTNPQANFVAQIHPILANGRQDDYAATFDSKADAHNFIAEFKTLAGGMKFLATIKRGSFFGEELYRHGLKGDFTMTTTTKLDTAKTYTLTIYTDVWADGDNTLVENYDTCRHLHISGKYLISKHSWKLTRGGKTIATGDGVKDFCHFITCEFDVSERLAEIADVKSASLEICGENVHFRNGKCIIVHSPKYHASFHAEAGIDGNEHYEINKSDERGNFSRFEFVTEEEFFNTLERRGGCTVDNAAGYDETAFDLLPTVDELNDADTGLPPADGEVEYMGDAQAILVVTFINDIKESKRFETANAAIAFARECEKNSLIKRGYVMGDDKHYGNEVIYEFSKRTQAILNDELSQLIRQRENLNSRLRNGLLTADEFNADAGEVDAAIRYVELQIDALKAGDNFNYANAAC